MSYLSELLNGAKVSNMAKKNKVSEATIYYRIIQDVINLNRVNGTNLPSAVREIRNNPEAYKNLIGKTQADVRHSKKPKSIHELLRFKNPLDAINHLEGDMRIGAIIMYNTLSND